MTLRAIGGGYEARADCLDLWPLSDEQPRVFDAEVNPANQPTLVFWVSQIRLVQPSVWAVARRTMAACFPSFLRASATQIRVHLHRREGHVRNSGRALSEDPRVGESMKLRIKVKNTGSMAGVADLVVKSVTDSGTPVEEGTVSTPVLGIMEESDWIEITLAPFATQTTGMYYTISISGSSEPVYDGSADEWAGVFNVKVQAEEDNLQPPAHRGHPRGGHRCARHGGRVHGPSRRRLVHARRRVREYEDDAAEDTFTESRFWPKSLRTLTLKWLVPCSSSRSGPKRKSRAISTRDGPLSRSRTGSTTSEVRACLSSRGPMRSGKTAMAAGSCFTARCPRWSTPTPCVRDWPFTGWRCWNHPTWLTCGCKRKRMRPNRRASTLPMRFFQAVHSENTLRASRLWRKPFRVDAFRILNLGGCNAILTDTSDPCSSSSRWPTTRTGATI